MTVLNPCVALARSEKISRSNRIDIAIIFFSYKRNILILGGACMRKKKRRIDLGNKSEGPSVTRIEWSSRVSTCYASPFWSVLLTNIGDIRSEGVHDINKNRAWRTGANKAAQVVGCTYFVGYILFIPGRMHECAIFFDSNIWNIWGRFGLSNFMISHIIFVFVIVTFFSKEALRWYKFRQDWEKTRHL